MEWTVRKMAGKKVECPHSKRGPDKWIVCRMTGKMCAFQRWCGMEGKALLTEGARGCLMRERNEQERHEE